MASVLIFPERRRNDLLDDHDKMVGGYKAIGSGMEREIPAAHLADSPGACAKFQKTTGLALRGNADLKGIYIESAVWRMLIGVGKSRRGNPSLCSREAGKPLTLRETKKQKLYPRGLSR